MSLEQDYVTAWRSGDVYTLTNLEDGVDSDKVFPLLGLQEKREFRVYQQLCEAQDVDEIILYCNESEEFVKQTLEYFHRIGLYDDNLEDKVQGFEPKECPLEINCYPPREKSRKKITLEDKKEILKFVEDGNYQGLKQLKHKFGYSIDQLAYLLKVNDFPASELQKKITKKRHDEIRGLSKTMRTRDLAEMYGLREETISRIKHHRI